MTSKGVASLKKGDATLFCHAVKGRGDFLEKGCVPFFKGCDPF
jgi:hypothetical protein